MSTTKPSAKILQAMELIGSPERWTKNTFARNSEGEQTTINNKTAVCFCSVGALDKVNASSDVKNYISKSVPHINSLGSEGIVDINDAPKTKHKDVMNMFMTAAFLALSEGK